MRNATASQTVGPFLHIGFDWFDNGELFATTESSAKRIVVQGKLYDGDGMPISDGVIELWQADAKGRYAKDASAGGFGRVASGAGGAFRFCTVKPGRVAGPGGVLQAPHIVVSIFARGLLKRLATRINFPDEPANACGPILALVPAERRATLIARPAGDAMLEWDARIQGKNETVFFHF